MKLFVILNMLPTKFSEEKCSPFYPRRFARFGFPKFTLQRSRCFLDNSFIVYKHSMGIYLVNHGSFNVLRVPYF